MIETVIALLLALPAVTMPFVLGYLRGHRVGYRQGVDVISDAVREEIQTMTTK